MIKWLLIRSRDPIVVTERVKMAAGCLNLVAIGILVGFGIGPLFNRALQVPISERVAAAFGFIALEGCAMIVLSFLPTTTSKKEDAE